MPIWKVTKAGPSKVLETKLKDEQLMESHLEDWVFEDPQLLGEPLLVLGRQVIIPEVKDRLDILALDPQGNAVIVELKRGKLKSPIDMQSLRYASYISRWRFEDFERLARAKYGSGQEGEFNFNDLYERFCADAGIDEPPNVNSDQRVIIVGAGVKDKLGSVALWLREHNVDIKVIEVEVYREGTSLLIQPNTIIPVPVSRFREVGGPVGESSQPWITDGKSWHLDKRCSQKTRDMLIKLNDIVTDNFQVDGPRWNQKAWITYRISYYNWLMIRTGPNMLLLSLMVKAGSFKQRSIAQNLGIVEWNKDESLAEKLSSPSSVLIKNQNENVDRIILRLKEDVDLESEALLKFLAKAYGMFPK